MNISNSLIIVISVTFLALLPTHVGTTQKQTTGIVCNPSCSKYGICKEKETSNTTFCSCEQFYFGKDCSVPWNKDSAWGKAHNAYSAITIILNTILAVWSAYELAVTFIYGKVLQWSRWNVVTYDLIFLFLGALCRILYYGIDPESFRGIFSPFSDYFLYSLAFFFWFIGAILMLLYWMELHLLSGVKEVQFLHKTRPVLYVALVVSTVFNFATAVWRAANRSALTLYVYNGMFAFFLISFIITGGYFGIQLRRRMHRIYKETRVESSKRFLQKITKLMLMCVVVFLLALITIGIFSFSNGSYQRWYYLIYHWILRVEEFAACLFMLLFLHKKVPKKVGLTESSSQDRGQSQTTDISLTTER